MTQPPIYPDLKPASGFITGGGTIFSFSLISHMMSNSECAPDRIRVNAVAPGWVATDRQKDLWVTPEVLAAHIDRQCLKDCPPPDDIPGGVLFLASDASRMMTGQSLVIDGDVVTTG